jgi:predicted DsbA family dithiol-disulfide isomerase
MNTTRTLRLQVVADLICPWCYIGKRSLDHAWKSWQGRASRSTSTGSLLLNPTLPSEGMDRRAFRRSGSVGTTRSRWMRAPWKQGAGSAPPFRYDLQSRTSNTVAAHALVRLARAEGGAKVQERVVDALFTGYFSEGKDIGDAAALEAIATAAGLAPGAVTRSVELHDDVRALDAGIKAAGVEAFLPTCWMASSSSAGRRTLPATCSA